MKWTFVRLDTAVLLLICCSTSFAAPVRIIYGTNTALNTNLETNKATYIQTGSFKRYVNAQKQQKIIQTKIKYGVHIKPKKGLYAVLIGPLYSSTEIRNTAVKLTPQLLTPKLPKKVYYTQTTVIQPIVAPKPSSNANWFVAVGGGVQSPMSISNMVVNNGSEFAYPYDQDLYSNSSRTGGVVAASAGRRWQYERSWAPAYSLGISWQYYFNNNSGNTITQYSIPEFLNYNYTWNFQSNLLLAATKINLINYGRFSPYINGGIGAAFNHTNGFTETALPNVTPRLSPGFASNTATQFAYQAGAGLDLQLNPQLFCSFGYNYQNLGKFSSGVGTLAWATQQLHANSYQSNEFLVTLNYLFGK